MAVSRAMLIERLLNGKKPDEDSVAATPSTSFASWDDVEQFENDTLREVENKLHDLDNLIWGKLIVMERNTRTAKAYLRNQTICIDGSRCDFDGKKFGVRRFANPRRDSVGDKCISTLSEGISLRIDSDGSVWACARGGLHLWTSRGMQSGRIEPFQEAMIFDLRAFKARLLETNPTSRLYDHRPRRQLLADSIVYIKCSPAPALTCPLWLCLIHLIAVEMTCMLHPCPSPSSLSSSSASPSPVASSSSFSSAASSAHSATPTRPLPPLPLTADTFDRDSRSRGDSGETSSFGESERRLLPSAVAEREKQRLAAMAYEKAAFTGFPSKMRGGVKKRLERTAMPVLGFSYSSTVDDCSAPRAPARPALSSAAPLSRSVIDLRCLAELRRPAYFASRPLGAGRRGGAGHHGSHDALHASNGRLARW